MKRIPILLFALFLAACAPGDIQIPQSPVLKFLERKSGSIAYIGNDGNVYVTDQGATNTNQITTDLTPETAGSILYQYPTWSPTEDRLAFMRLEQTGPSELTTDIFITETNGGTSRSVYSSKSQFPVYFNWAPDGQSLTALTTTASKQTLALISVPINGGEPRVIDTGSPLYWSWAPDGMTMIVHKNGANPNAADQISFLKLDADVTEIVAADSPASFQAPAWSPDGNHILLTTVSANGKQQLILADSTGTTLETVTEYDFKVSFAWASDGEHFAYISGEEELAPSTLGPLHIAGAENTEEIVIDEKVFAYFWSPDALEIAYLIPFVAQPEDSSEQILYFELHILDIANKESRLVASFQPTEGFTSIVPYIDQYHQSTTIWSPDGKNLVISFVDINGVSGLAIVPTSGITEPRILVEGTYAAWSWR